MVVVGVAVVVVDIVMVLTPLTMSNMFSVVFVGMVTFFTPERDDEHGQ